MFKKTMASQECQICFDTFNGSNRKPCACQYCAVQYCRECIYTWLTTLIDEPRCPNDECKKPWSREYLDGIVTKVWRDSTYREYREKLMMDKERALLPATQPRIEAINESNRIKREIIAPMRDRRKEIAAQIAHLNAEETMLSTQMFDLERTAQRLREGIGISDQKQKAAFVRRCPADGCRGFLSTAWKCGTCELYSCPDCHEVKGVARDSQHTCDQANIETAKLLAKDTKACPKCGEMITKIDGCDQMWCVSCHTAFSWRTGQIALGTVHNPHFYEWQRRQGSGVAPRVAGDIPCGGLPDWSTVRGAMAANSSYPIWMSYLESAHQKISHIANVEIPTLNRDNGGDPLNRNIDLRIAYLLKEIDESTMTNTLIRRDTAYEKHRETVRVYDTLVQAGADIFRRIIELGQKTPPAERDRKIFDPLITELDSLRLFINDALDMLRRRYNCTLHGFDNGWSKLSLKKTKGSNDTPKSQQMKTKYCEFNEALEAFETEFEKFKKELPADKRQEVERIKYMLLRRKLRQLANSSAGFPNAGRGTDTSYKLAEDVYRYYSANVSLYEHEYRPNPAQYEINYWTRLMAQRADAVEKWKEHVKTLDMFVTLPSANPIE